MENLIFLCRELFSEFLWKNCSDKNLYMGKEKKNYVGNVFLYMFVKFF